MTDYKTWMSNSTIQTLQLENLVLPGTHDSATYSLTTNLAQGGSSIEYSDIALLWQLNNGSAPNNGVFPWQNQSDGKTIFYLGSPMYDFVMNVVQAIATAQDQTILEQLNGGIRFFDLRVYFDVVLNDYYLQHALHGCTLSNVLQQIQQFIQQNPNAAELILLQISHTNFANLNKTDAPAAVQNLLRQYLGGSLYTPPGAAGVSNFHFNSLAKLTVSSMTGGKTKVMVLNTDALVYPDILVNTTGFASSGRGAGGTDNVEQLGADEYPSLVSNQQGNLYEVSWTLTPQMSDIYTQLNNSILNPSAVPILKQLAGQANAELFGFMEQARVNGGNCNLITVDWYDYSSPESGNKLSVVDVAVGLSRGGV